MPDATRGGEKILRGIPVSPGVCRGLLMVLSDSSKSIPRREVPESDLGAERARLEAALVETRRQILEIQRRVEKAMGAEDASIFDAHLLVLEDEILLEEITRFLTQEQVNAEYAFYQVSEKYSATLAAIEDEYLRERAADLRDVTHRVLNNLLGRKQNPLEDLSEPCVIVSRDLSPSITAQMDRKMVLGFITEVGGQTSHSAILARSLRIPAVVGSPNLLGEVRAGQYALLDGYNGKMVINPTDQTLYEYGQLVRQQLHLEEKLRDTLDQPAITLDGKQVILSANIGEAADIEAVRQSGAEGVGLFRTEYLFINRQALPTEEEQYEAYRQVAEALKPHPVVIRTLDLGGDKFATLLPVPREMNPFLGWRAIRFCLQQPAIFNTQLRAICRASVVGNIKMMYPMISSIGELLEANEMLAACQAQLEAEGIPHDKSMEVGIMIEIPAAAVIADKLGRHSKFFSVGTNDLIQYSVAVDRLNEKIAHLYEPSHPAILQLIHRTVQAGQSHQIWTGVCGEMAGELAMVPLLLGLGIDELSVSPPSVPRVKFLIRRLKLSEAQKLAAWALEQESAGVIRERAEAFARQIAPSLYDTQTKTPTR